MNKTLKKLFADFTKNNGKKIFFTIIFWWIIIAILDIVTPFFYKEIISVVEVYLKTDYFDKNWLIKIFIIWWAFITWSTIIKSVIEFITAKSNLTNYKINHKKYSKKITNLDYWTYLNEKTWSLFKIYDRWIEDQVEMIYIIFWELLISILSIIIIWVLLFIINVKLAIATLIMIIPMLFISIFFHLQTRKLQDKINVLRDKSFWILWDILSNLSLVKTLSLEKIFKKKLEKNIDIADKSQKTVIHRWIIADVLTGLFIAVSRLLVMWTWICLLLKWETDFATLFLFFAFVGHIYFPIMWISKRLKIIQKKLKWIENFYNKFENIKTEKEDKNKKILKNIKWEIEYKDVIFSYTDNKIILNKINFKINPWEKIALVWNTWAGKSTIVNLLFRFWEINSWEIKIDWINIKDITKESLRKNIGYVMQDNSLFNTTIKENLLFANQKATEKEIKQALKNAKADFVFKLKDWLNTVIWERGLKLSWWEKQRISIARLFLKNPQIIVLDEATSALDNKTEKEIQKALDKLIKWRTSIIIAHRLSTIQNADKIYMLENWKIVESGTYEELINKKAKFYNLANPEHLILN